MSTEDREIRATLARVLASSGFVAAPNLAAFLRYVVEETLAGRGDRLKAYTIAVEALDRADNFDPNDNPLVRVQARRLRAALTRWYETEGADAPVVIDLPVGSYVPRFLPREAVAGGRERSFTRGGLRSPLGRILSGLVYLSLGAGVVAGGWWGWTLWQVEREAARREALVRAPSDPSLGLEAAQVLPLLTIEVDSGPPLVEGVDVETYRRRLESFAARFDDVVVVSRAANLPSPTGQPRYRLAVALSGEGTAVTAHYRLSRLDGDRLLTTGAYRLLPEMRLPYRPGSTLDTPTDLDILRDMIVPGGLIAVDAVRNGEVGEPLACLAMSSLFAGEANATVQRAARGCLEAAVAANPRLAPACAA